MVKSVEEQAEAEVSAPIAAPVVADRISAADEAKFAAKSKRMGEILRAQPKRRIRISKELFGVETFVGINGYKFVIQNGVAVEVPEQVAQLLEESGRI